MDKHIEFNRAQLNIKPLEERTHDLDISAIRVLEKTSFPASAPLEGGQGGVCALAEVANRIRRAKANGSSVILMMGGHVIRSGVQRYIIDMMEQGYLSCIAMNGAGMIHDFEFALIGATTESVARYIREGQFGLWRETGKINEIINAAYRNSLGMGEAVGKTIAENAFPYKDISILAAGYSLQIPITVHIGIGYDIIHEHPNCDGAAMGATSYRDFLRFAKIVENLEGGVVMNFGSAVMAPEIYLKALSMARNVAHQENRAIQHFTTLVCDLHPLPQHFNQEASKDDPSYYFRPWKTMLVRTVADGGESFYVRGRHAETLPALWSNLVG